MPPDQDACAAAGIGVYPARADASWVLNRRTGATVLIDNSLASLLPFLVPWRTPEAHRAALEKSGATVDARESFKEIQELGLLVTRGEFLRLVPGTGPGPARQIDVAAWCTRDRPTVLGRSVESFLRNFKRHGHQPSILVLDDSREPASQQETRKAARDAAAASGTHVRYAAEKEKRSLVDRVLEQDEEIPRAVMEFALFGVPGLDDTTGANRNALHLATCGKVVFSADDDTVGQFAAPAGGPLQGAAVSFIPDPNEYEYFLDRPALEQVVSWEEPDILGAHRGLVGAALAELDPSMDGCAASLTESLALHGGTAAAVMTGICGDSGLGNPRNILVVQGRAGDLLMKREELYRAAAVNRLMRRSVRRPTLSGSALFQGTCVTVDNRRTVPPCMPVLRNWDGTFGQTLRCCLPEALIGHVPWAVRHDPPEERSFPAGALTGFELRFSEVLGILLSGFERTASARGGDRLEGLGDHLLSIAGLPDRSFLSRVRDGFLEHASPYVAALEALVASRGGAPPYWSADIKAHMESFTESILSAGFGIPVDVARGRGEAEAVTLTRELVGRFGDLLCWWTDIREAAALVDASACLTDC